MDSQMMASAQALQQLIAGNRRYAAGRQEHPRQTPEARQVVAQGQQPVAVILTCADSRVPPEIFFDQGLGDLFVVRVAGNIADDTVIASVEYAVEYLGVPLVVVLGHSRCGAVTAATQEVEVSGYLGGLLAAIRPAVAQARDLLGDLVDNAARTHVGLMVERLRTCQPILNRLAEEGRVRVMGAFYCLDSGAVEFLKG